MRILVASTANDGHFGPLLPVARACVAAGHEVRVAAPKSYAASVTSAGFAHEPFADAPPELIGPVMGRLPTLGFDEANETVIRDVFGRIDAQAALPAVTAIMEAWHPDVVLREPAELGSLAAAERAGVPHAQVAIGMLEVCDLFARLVPEPLAELDRLAGLPDGRSARALAEEPVLTSVPEVLDRAAGDGAMAGPTDVRRFRDPGLVAPPGDLPPSWGDPDHPLVYVTFGSVTGSLPPFAGVFREALDALADQRVRVLMTVGRRVDLEALGPLPGNAHVAPWWHQAGLLPHVSAVLGHGGFGTTMGALAAGVPQVVAPIFTSDQVVNGRHVAAVGAGVVVEPGPDVVTRGAAALTGVLDDPSYASAARVVAAAIADLPGPEETVPGLAALASDT